MKATKSSVGKELQQKLSGNLALALDEGLTPFQQRLWADVLGLKLDSDWTEADRPALRAYVDAWEAYRKAKDVKAQRQIFAHIAEIGSVLRVLVRSREKNTSSVNNRNKGIRAKQTMRALKTLSAQNGEGLLAS
jgi:phage terminase small subunit